VSEQDEVFFEKRGVLGLITLNRPWALNALTHGMCVSMKAQLDNWAKDDGIKSVVVRGAGDRAFCAGGDIRALYDSGKAGTPYALDFYRDEYLLDATVKHFPKPYIAMIHGFNLGGGVGVSVNGRYRIAGETMIFAMPETGIGLFPDVGGSYFLPRCPGQIGMYLGLTGGRLNTADCLYTGIATHFVPIAKWKELVGALADGAEAEPAIAAVQEAVPDAFLSAHREAIDRIFAAGSVEDILSALDAEHEDWTDNAARTIREKSPTSLKLAFRQLREGAKLEFDDCMRMEYRMVTRVVAGHEFYEGVRATIIDKDGAPKWQPADLAQVSDADIAVYFAPLGDKELKL
jgi:enoyl-CoA hydratase